MSAPSTGEAVAPEPERLSPDAFRSRLGDGRLGQVFDYWNAKRPAGALPAREAIDPSELTRLLPWLYLLEPGAAGDGTPARARVRLAGTRIRELFDRELTGQDLAESLPQPFAGNAARSYGMVVEQRCGWLTVVDSHLRDGRVLTYRRLSLPLGRDGLRVDRILGAVDWDEWMLGSQPFWELYEEALSRRRVEATCRFDGA